MVAVFDVDEFVRDVAAVAPDPGARRAAEAILARALAAPADVADAIAPPAGGITLLHHAPDLTIINVAWAPKMELMPHDHRMWALIGIYAGAEDNRFFRRADDGLTESGDRRIEAGEVCALGTSTIHA